MISQDDLPIIYERRGLPLAGRLILVAGGVYCLWAWVSSLEPSWTMPFAVALWFIPAIAAPFGGRTIIDASGIVRETRWLWGLRRRKFQAVEIKDVKISARQGRLGRREPFFVVDFRTGRGDWHQLAAYASREGAEAMEGFLRSLNA